MTAERLEYLRSQIRAESISMSELVELQGMTDQIDPSDVELLEWAGVPEFTEEPDNLVQDFDLGDGDTLHVNVTHEGVIFDCIRDGEVIATSGMTAVVVGSPRTRRR